MLLNIVQILVDYKNTTGLTPVAHISGTTSQLALGQFKVHDHDRTEYAE